ncbi:uncharacterized protein LOC134776732 [Penaeus indicus]|uniref:uncharacterized protein LOC134776732 n=1 Tax=Penaeus indicus TaxID=29960 RepID=UPI00300D376B
MTAEIKLGIIELIHNCNCTITTRQVSAEVIQGTRRLRACRGSFSRRRKSSSCSVVLAENLQQINLTGTVPEEGLLADGLSTGTQQHQQQKQEQKQAHPVPQQKNFRKTHHQQKQKRTPPPPKAEAPSKDVPPSPPPAESGAPPHPLVAEAPSKDTTPPPSPPPAEAGAPPPTHPPAAAEAAGVGRVRRMPWMWSRLLIASAFIIQDSIKFSRSSRALPPTLGDNKLQQGQADCIKPPPDDFVPSAPPPEYQQGARGVPVLDAPALYVAASPGGLLTSSLSLSPLLLPPEIVVTRPGDDLRRRGDRRTRLEGLGVLPLPLKEVLDIRPMSFTCYVGTLVPLLPDDCQRQLLLNLPSCPKSTVHVTHDP